MKHILVIGSSSMIGSRFIELTKDTFQFSIADKTIIEKSDNTFPVDITDSKSVSKALGASKSDVVVLFSAMTDVSQAEQERGDKEGLAWKINVDGATHVAKACQAYGRQLVYISTDYVFKGDNGPYTEEDQAITGPDEGSWYGWTKRRAEMTITEMLGEKVIIVRPAYPFRAHFTPKVDFVRKLIKRFRENDLYPLFDDQMISPVFIDDFASALACLIQHNQKGIFHLVGSSILSPYAVALEIASIFGFENKIEHTSLETYIRSQNDQFAMLRYPRNAALINDKINNFLASCNQKMHTFTESLRIMKEQGVEA